MKCKCNEYHRAEARAVENHRSQLCEKRGCLVSREDAEADWERHHAMQWRRNRHRKMAVLQQQEIERHKWIESMKAGRDLGREAQLDWIHRYAAQWRDWFEEHCDDENLLEEVG